MIAKRNRANPPRDQAESPFTNILRELRLSSGSQGIALVDFEGETVDYVGWVDPYELKVMAAHFQLVLGELRENRVTSLRQITIRTAKRGFIVRKLPSDYALVMVLHRHAAFASSSRAIDVADASVSAEAGWSVEGAEPRWLRIDVESDSRDKRRPKRVHVDDDWHQIEIVGTMVGLPSKERGYWVRLPSGREFSLVRDRSGFWFLGQNPASA